MDFRHRYGVASILVIILTFLLFAIALFAKGLTQDLLLEAGVFLVSVKLIIMSSQNAIAVEAIRAKLDEILAKEEQLEHLVGVPKNT